MSDNGGDRDDHDVAYYRIPPQFDVIRTPEEFVFSNGTRHITVTGDSISILEDSLPALKRGRTLSNICEAANIDEEIARVFLDTLMQNDIIAETRLPREDWVDREDVVRFHYHHRTDHEHAATAPIEFETRPLVVHPTLEGLPSTEAITVGLGAESTTHADLEATPTAGALLSITFGHSPDLNRSLEHTAHNIDVPVLFVRLFMDSVLIGPFHIPDETVSFDTAYRRAKTNVEDPMTEMRVESDMENQPRFPLLEEHRTVIQTYATAELRAYLGRTHEPQTATGVIEFDLETLESNYQRILQLPDQAPENLSK